MFVLAGTTHVKGRLCKRTAAHASDEQKTKKEREEGGKEGRQKKKKKLNRR